MPANTFTCPECDDQFSGRRGTRGTVTCPSCGALVRGKAREPVPESEDEEDEDSDREDAPDDADDRRKVKRTRTQIPGWVWTVVTIGVGLGGAVVWFGFLAGPTPDPRPDAQPPAADEVAAGRPGGGPAPRSPFATDAEPRKMTAPPAPVPAELADAVFLLPDDLVGDTSFGPDLFERELARQALGIAAREDFGLRVRDSSLGDVAPAGLPGDRQFRLRRVQNYRGAWSAVAGLPGAEHQFWTGPLHGQQYSVSPDKCLAEYERLTREFFAKCLTAAGIAARPNRPSDTPVPAEAEQALGQMRETDQFAAVRTLHDEIRAKGESDALVAGLVRGYANLALLTEFHWGATPYVFKARAVLYAQRLLARTPKAPDALRLRAYAAALAGWHVLALQDLAAAEKLAAAGPPAPVPAWAEAVDHYVHFDLAKLRAARGKADSPLLRVLEFLALEAPEAEAATIRAGRALLEAEPECYLVHDVMCRVGGVAHLHRATLAGPVVFGRRVAARVNEMPGLPAEVRAVLGGAFEPGVYATLRAAGAADRGEPSWAVLGGLLQEVRFTQAAHRLNFVTDWWGVDPRAEASAFASLLDGHRSRPFIESYLFDHRTAPAEVRRRLTAPDGEVDAKARAYLARLAKVDPAAAQARQMASHGHLYPEELRRVRLYRGDRSGAQHPFARQLLATSPHTPIGQAISIAYGGPQPAAKLAETEARYADHPVVLWGLGQRHLADGRREDAVRCWKRWAELSPDGGAFRELAGLYRAAGDEERWLETLEASLKEEDTGLSHAQVRVEIAKHFMRAKDFRRAEPYATAAAASGAGWAMLCAAECHEGLEEWDAANDLYAAAAERYRDPAFAWYFSCRFTGKMDRQGAERAVRVYMAEFGAGTTPAELFRAARFHLLVGEQKTARELIDRSNRSGPSDLGLLFAALLADAAGDAASRDRSLDQFEKLPPAQNRVRPIGAALRSWAGEEKIPDAAAVEAAVRQLAPEYRADAEFCFGWYLHNRKLGVRAVALWTKCLKAETGTSWVKTHARALIEAVGPKRD
ncbi:MAG: hypothetical protein J0I06_28545 [Planctomycetes bacterium]|nr:hypothetical protein [Planctomycetota bacterium]